MVLKVCKNTIGVIRNYACLILRLFSWCGPYRVLHQADLLTWYIIRSAWCGKYTTCMWESVSLGWLEDWNSSGFKQCMKPLAPENCLPYSTPHNSILTTWIAYKGWGGHVINNLTCPLIYPSNSLITIKYCNFLRDIYEVLLFSQ